CATDSDLLPCPPRRSSDLEVGALHLHWPWPFSQSRQIDDMAPLLAETAQTAILAGDLNATPWSAAAARIADAGDMTRIGPAGPRSEEHTSELQSREKLVCR